MRRKNPPPPPPSPDQAARLGVLMQRFMDQVNRRAGGATLGIMAESGLTLPQIVAMHVVHAREGIDVGAVAEAIRLTPSTTSHLVDRLVEKDLLDRAENPDDRRQKRLRLTDSGRDLLDRIGRSRAGELTQVMERLRPATLRQLADVFEKVLGQLEEEGNA